MFELRMEITLQLRFDFALHCDVFSLRYNYLIYLFNIVMFFDNVRITLYFDIFELLLEITLQLRYVCARLCDVILLGSSVKWNDPGHFLESQGKFFLSFPCTLFLHIFDI